MHKILIIDDEPAILEMYKVKLEEAKFTVLTAINGEEGLKLAEQEKPDAILLDIIMPRINGFDVLKELKQSSKTKGIDVFMTTNLPERTSGQKAQELGAVGYLVKAEYEPAMIADVLEKHFAETKS